MNTKLVIFDLDGTTLDSLGDIALACNHTLSLNGLPQHDIEEYKIMVGNGTNKLLERCLPENLRTQEFIEEIKKDFVAFYSDNMTEYSKPFEGIVELLKELNKRGVGVAIASNKLHYATVNLVNHFFGDIDFVEVFGNVEGVALKPSREIVDNINSVAKVELSEILFVGDTKTDIMTAKNAGVRGVGVLWGSRQRAEFEAHGADYIVAHPSEILELL